MAKQTLFSMRVVSVGYYLQHSVHRPQSNNNLTMQTPLIFLIISEALAQPFTSLPSGCTIEWSDFSYGIDYYRYYRVDHVWDCVKSCKQESLCVGVSFSNMVHTQRRIFSLGMDSTVTEDNKVRTRNRSKLCTSIHWITWYIFSWYNCIYWNIMTNKSALETQFVMCMLCFLDTKNEMVENSSHKLILHNSW